MIDISKETLTRWKGLYEQGDAWELVSMHSLKAYPEMFHRAFKLGRCNKAVYDTMKTFFDKKEKAIKKAIAA